MSEKTILLVEDDRDQVTLATRALRKHGIVAVSRLRGYERTELVPVILFSSSREEIVEGYTLGANSYVTKPANFARFSEAMQYLGWY
jgi:two-component system, response regulator